MKPQLVTLLFLAHTLCPLTTRAAGTTAAASWTIGEPIVTYWCGPAMTDAVATQMADGGWNLVWCQEGELEIARRHGLRAQLTDSLLTPASLDTPGQRQKLDALIGRVRNHPALYAYFITDEPGAGQFPALGRLVTHLRERDPAHLAYINLFPTYASNEQLGNKGDVVAAYREHLRQFVEVVKPALVSYDHYQFTLKGDTDQYFLNLALVRRAALEAGVPFLNIVQASSWAPDTMRVPGPDEMRYLVYTTLAYGAAGISYYIYTCGNHLGGIANADGTPTGLYAPLQKLNREFKAIAAQLQLLDSMGVYHAGMQPRGTAPIPADLPLQLDPPVPAQSYQPPAPVTGIALGCFRTRASAKAPNDPTHMLVVNLDYQRASTVGLRAKRRLEVFDPATGSWSKLSRSGPSLELPPGGGALVRLR